MYNVYYINRCDKNSFFKDIEIICIAWLCSLKNKQKRPLYVSLFRIKNTHR